MDFSYDFTYEMLEGMGSAIGTGELVYNIAMILLGIAGYILRSAGMYTIAKRRGISNAWLSWVPVAWIWVLGSISDQFRYVTKAQVKYKRVTLLVMNIITSVVCIATLAIVGIKAVDLVDLAITGGSEEELMMVGMSFFFQFMAMMLLMVGVLLATSIARYIALYDLFISATPSNAVLFLILSIFFSTVEPFFIFFSRKKDKGMPPRCDVPQAPLNYVETAYQPAPPAIEPWEASTEE